MTKNLPASVPSAVALLTGKLAARFDMGDVDVAELIDILKKTAFKDQNGNPPSDAQIAALLIVADQYGLNPWLKEIHAFPAKGGGIVPIVGVDGWSNIINNNPQMDGMEFEVNWEEGNEHITCSIWRKDRNRPIKVSEYLSECIRGTEPWKMKRRMLRHKAMIQCGRVAFGYGGIHDPDEAQDILANEKFMGPADVVGTGNTATGASAQADGLPAMTDEDFAKREAKVREFYAKGKTAAEVIAFYSTKFTVPEPLQKRIREMAAPAADTDKVTDVQPKDGPKVTYAGVAESLNKAANTDELSQAAILIAAVPDEQQRVELTALYETLLDELKD